MPQALTFVELVGWNDALPSGELVVIWHVTGEKGIAMIEGVGIDGQVGIQGLWKSGREYVIGFAVQRRKTEREKVGINIHGQ